MWSFLVRKLHEQHMFYGFCIWDTNSTSNFCRYKSALINIWCLLFTSSINLTNSSNMQIYIRILPFKSDRHNEVSFTSQCHLKCISFLGDLSPRNHRKCHLSFYSIFAFFLCFYLKQTFFRKFKIVLKLQMFLAPQVL